MEYKNLKSYKSFLNEKYNLILEGDDLSDEEKEKRNNIAFVKDPNNPLDEAINGKIELLKKKIDPLIKDDDGKQIYTAYAYSNMKMVEIEEQIIKLKNKFFMEAENPDGEEKTDEEKAQDAQADESINYNFTENLNEGLLKKLWDFASKKLMKYAEKIKAAKKMDPIFEEAKLDIEKLFEDKKMIQGWKEKNAENLEEIQKGMDAKVKELSELTKEMSEKLDKALEDEENGDDVGGFKPGGIYSYENKEGVKFRIIITKDEPLTAIRISDNDADTKLVDEEPLEKLGSEFEPSKEKISIIAEENIEEVQKTFTEIMDQAKKEFDIKQAQAQAGE